jgi:hypothetical protein
LLNLAEPYFYHELLAPFVPPEARQESAMRRDLLVISGGMLAVGVVVWAFCGNPESVSGMHPTQVMKSDAELKLVSERSPYMRTER